MYYEEKIMGNFLYYRTDPKGEWKKLETPRANVFNMLRHLSEKDRLDLFHKFCVHCGSDNPRCQCWNDE